jgi:hypothetical protein
VNETDATIAHALKCVGALSRRALASPKRHDLIRGDVAERL